MSDFAELHGVIVGLGSIGNRHLQNCLKLGVGQLTVVRRAESQNEQFQVPNKVEVTHELNSALSENPDFAIICNPSHMHVSTAEECLEAGCHVLIEKPLSANIGPAEKSLQDLAEKSDRIAAMAYCMRYHPAYREAQRQLSADTLGRVHYAKAWFEGYLPDWHPWENYRTSYAARRDQAGGVLRTLDHELDFLNWTLGSAEQAQGWTTNTGGIDIEADDLAMYQLRHPTGTTSQVTVSFCRKPASRGFEFVGEEGTLRFCMEEGKLLHATHDSTAEPAILVDVAEYDINQMYVDLVLDFLTSIMNGSRSTDLAMLESGLHCTSLFPKIDSTVTPKAADQ